MESRVVFRDPAAPEPAVYTQDTVLGTGWVEAFEGLALCSYFTFGAGQAAAGMWEEL